MNIFKFMKKKAAKESQRPISGHDQRMLDIIKAEKEKQPEGEVMSFTAFVARCTIQNKSLLDD